MFLIANIRGALVLLYLIHYCESVLRDIYWNTNDYRISKPGMRPTYYRLIFTPNFEKRTFKLQCVVSINITRWTALYKFYVKNLSWEADSCVFESFDIGIHGPNDEGVYITPRKRRSAAEPGDIIHIMTDVLHDPQYDTEFVLHCQNIVGSLMNQLRGFYYDEYYENGHTMNFLTTQFGPFGTRYAFPSFDEPGFRAKFRIIIHRPIEYSCVISNSRLISSIISGELMEDEFEITEDISPTSLAFMVSKLKTTELSHTSIHQFVLRKEVLTANMYEFASVLINHAYQEIEDFIGVSCELQHLYHIGLPSNRLKFDNLGSYRGINQYKESVLLISNNISSVEEESSTVAIVKLLAQQWFINYISLEYWTWAWLSEGFTMYLSYNITDKMFPFAIMNERLVCDIRHSMQIDSGSYTVALNDEAMKPSEIESKFNEVTLFKGTALIITMERILPPSIFKEGLKDLFVTRKWSTYTSKTFFDIIETRIKSFDYQLHIHLPMSFSEIMLTWEGQVGYPLLTVTRNYDSDISSVHLSQERFWFHKNSKSVWAIPINFASPHCRYFNNTRPIDWLISNNGHITIKDLRRRDWLIVNNQATYYYRVNYDERNWLLIIETLQTDHESIHYLNRMQIIDDAFSLAEYGFINYEIAFNVSSYIMREREYAPLKAMKDAYYSVNKKILYSKVYDNFQMTIKHSVEFIYNQLYCERCATPDSFGEHRYNLIIHMLFSWLCDLNSETCCCDTSPNKNFRRNSALPLELQNDFEKKKLCIYIQKGKKEQWNQLFENYKSLKNESSQKDIMFNALLCTEDGGLQHRFLNYVMKSDKYKLIEALKLANTNECEGLDATLKFILRYFTYLLKEFTYREVADILNDIGSRISTEKQLQTLTKFSEKHANYRELIELPISRAKQNLIWKKKYLNKIDTYANRVESSATISYTNVHIVILCANLYLYY